ncbi:DUF302 domain-containing protein [Actinoplanes sp. M2I2]|uniref:DUF302 domain-containing protein n=1 Tax=Actinoplanes sp. M2I2 TaxID=1734444 RepID=UPI002020448A|nr:DUF302 domain-containing protein [Actinoplanes sp. M2I2]
MTSPLIATEARQDVATVVRRVTSLLAERGITLFATIDHAAGAREAGLDLADEVVLIFGSPATGTPLMQQDPRVGIALPLRLLVWSQDGRTRIGYDDPTALAGRYDLDSDQILQRMRDLLAGLAAAAAETPAAR